MTFHFLQLVETYLLVLRIKLLLYLSIMKKKYINKLFSNKLKLLTKPQAFYICRITCKRKRSTGYLLKRLLVILGYSHLPAWSAGELP